MMSSTINVPDGPCHCCCSGPKKCCQLYSTTWSCAGETWSSPTTVGDITCIDPATVNTTWTQVGDTCEYQIYAVGKCCTDATAGSCAAPDAPDAPTCAPTNCCLDGTCPIQCATCCCATYTVTITGGSCIDGDHVMTLTDTDCVWQGDGCGMSCSGQITEGMTTIPASWTMAFNGDDLGCSCDDVHGGFLFTAAATGDCPPVTGWTLVENTCADPAVTGTPVVGTITKSDCPGAMMSARAAMSKAATATKDCGCKRKPR